MNELYELEPKIAEGFCSDPLKNTVIINLLKFVFFNFFSFFIENKNYYSVKFSRWKKTNRKMFSHWLSSF